MDLNSHRQMGILLREGLRLLAQARTGAGCAPKTSTTGRKLLTAHAALEKARCALDDVLAEEFPEMPDQEFFSVYYHRADDTTPRPVSPTL